MADRSRRKQDLENASILVVDDEVLIRMDTMYVLEDAGYCVVEAANSDEGNAAVEAAVKRKVHGLTERFPLYSYLG